MTGSMKSGLIAFPISQLWLIISLQVFKLSPSYYTKKLCYAMLEPSFKSVPNNHKSSYGFPNMCNWDQPVTIVGTP